MKITREELFKLARISKLEIRESEIDGLMKNLQAVLDYAERVCQTAEDIKEPSIKNVNIMRKDLVIAGDPEKILVQAPVHEDGFFIVPKIL